MGWTTPVNEATGYVVTSTDWDNFLSGTAGNEAFLYGDTSWTTVSSFTNSWTAGSLTPQYMICGQTVFMRGRVTGGSLATVAFTLPVGYRPGLQMWLPAVTNSGASAGTLVVQTAGGVQPQIGSTTQFQLDCCFSTK